MEKPKQAPVTTKTQADLILLITALIAQPGLQKGDITELEFVNYCKQIAPNQNLTLLHKIFTLLDKDHTKKINIRHFMAYLGSLTMGTFKDKATTVFRALDENNDGKLSYEELHKGCIEIFQKSIELSENEELNVALRDSFGIEIPEEKVSSLRSSQQIRVQNQKKVAKGLKKIFEADDNKDGKISLDEFLKHANENSAIKAVIDFYYEY